MEALKITNHHPDMWLYKFKDNLLWMVESYRKGKKRKDENKNVQNIEPN